MRQLEVAVRVDESRQEHTRSEIAQGARHARFARRADPADLSGLDSHGASPKGRPGDWNEPRRGQDLQGSAPPVPLEPGRIGSYSIHVTTTVHLPAELLQQVDRRAEELGMSRNRYIRSALEQAVRTETAWSGPFLEMLERAKDDEQRQSTVDEMMRHIGARRSSKRPPRL